jgi:hypothetical protein
VAAGRLLTVDAVLLLGISLLLTVVLAVALHPPDPRRRKERP